MCSIELTAVKSGNGDTLGVFCDRMWYAWFCGIFSPPYKILLCCLFRWLCCIHLAEMVTCEISCGVQILVLCSEMERLEIGLEHLRDIKVQFGVAVWILMLCVLQLLRLISQRMPFSFNSLVSLHHNPNNNSIGL